MTIHLLQPNEISAPWPVRRAYQMDLRAILASVCCNKGYDSQTNVTYSLAVRRLLSRSANSPTYFCSWLKAIDHRDVSHSIMFASLAVGFRFPLAT